MVGVPVPSPTESSLVLKRRTRTLSATAAAVVLTAGALSACGDGKDASKSTALDQTTVSGGSATEARWK